MHTFRGLRIAVTDLKCGDIVFDLDGNRRKVLFVNNIGPALEIMFFDGKIWGLSPSHTVQIAPRDIVI